MFKIDKVKNLFNCDDCNQLLFEPVTLPCGNSVCKRHLNPFPNSFKCAICHNEHPVPNEGFVISKRIQIALDIQLYNLKLDPKADQCKTKLEELKNIAAELEKLTLNPEDYLYEYFEEIKSKVDLRRETLKAKIDEFSDELIESIEVTKAYHFTLSKQINKQTTQIIQSQNELNNLIAQFDTFEINYNKIENTETCIASLKQKFNKLLVQYKEALLEEKNYAFSYDAGNIGKIFGSFQINRDTKLFSTILNKNSIQYLNKLCTIELENWSLIYRGTRDGFGAKDFHRKCDRILNTLTVIKSTSGNIFGGFTEKPWSTENSAITDYKAFVFSLKNYSNKPFKAVCSRDSEYAIGCYSDCGPVFGADTKLEIYIESNSNTNKKSFSDFGLIYRHPDYQYGTDKAECILAGSHYFKTAEIEIYTKELMSTILNNDMIQALNRLCEIELKTWSLVYRASRDGFRSEDFHSNCDGISNTITVIKATNGNVFGGFTVKAWQSNNLDVTDSRAYIFSLINEEDRPFKVVCSNEGQYAICGDLNFGPCFGGDGKTLRDIVIMSDSNSNQESFSSLGFSYKHPDYLCDTEKANSILAGSSKFQTLEIEVYMKINK